MASGKNPKKMSDANIKRKADESPETEKPYLQLRCRGSLPDLQEAAELSQANTLPEAMKKSFMDPEVMKEFAPVIYKQLQPTTEAWIRLVIEKSVENSVANDISRAVDDALRKFKAELMDHVLKEKKFWNCASLKAELEDRDTIVKSLENQVGKLNKGLNDLELYGRRNNIRLNNVPSYDTSECESTVLDILNEALPVGQSLSPGDIDRYHPIGKHNKKDNRQVIVKFVSYKLKAQVYDAASDYPMTEDFTSENRKLVDKLTQFKKAKKIESYLSYDG